MPPTSYGEWPVNSVKNLEDTWLNLELTGKRPPEMVIIHNLGPASKSPPGSHAIIVHVTFALY